MGRKPKEIEGEVAEIIAVMEASCFLHYDYVSR
jgi:hypothetical protein